MTESGRLSKKFVALQIDGVELQVAAMCRDGKRAPIVCLHGFGSSKEDYADLAGHPAYEDRGLLAFDAPGCGETVCSDLSALSIPYLKTTAEDIVRHVGIERFHLIGHSMGGLTALLLAAANPEAILSFTNIKGNLAPEDCFLSRQILDYPSDDPAAFIDAFADRIWQAPEYSSALFASSLRHKVKADAVGPIFRSMVDLSDQGALLETFTGLRCPTMFVYGEQYRELSYLETLMCRGVQLAQIPSAGHFPMYSNPTVLWERIAAFIDLAEREQHIG